MTAAYPGAPTALAAPSPSDRRCPSGAIVSGIGGVLLAVLGGILGFLLLLAGIIWMVVQRRRTA